ncbi:D-aminoacyl-tRNA deacylase [Desulfococcaceae bacterium HSG7]|nr:D-aminoacyl-tRNA deacylase [Desulfococcaceae bacterium HSG7]
MRAVIQRVIKSSVTINAQVVGEIGCGLLVLLGIANGDSEQDGIYLADKICNLRIFEDNEGKMNRSVIDTGGAILIVSQFTLLGNCRKGRRPSYTDAASPERAKVLYEHFVSLIYNKGVTVKTGRFGAMMQVCLVNDGPVTLII